MRRQHGQGNLSEKHLIGACLEFQGLSPWSSLGAWHQARRPGTGAVDGSLRLICALQAEIEIEIDRKRDWEWYELLKPQSLPTSRATLNSFQIVSPTVDQTFKDVIW